MVAINDQKRNDESRIQRDYFQQFRDILFFVNKAGKIVYASSLIDSIIPEFPKVFNNINVIFPRFEIEIKDLSDLTKESKYSVALLHNSNWKLWGEAIRLNESKSFEIEYLVIIHNPKATAFILDLLSEEPQEYIRDFFKDNIRQFIFFSNEINNFLEVIHDRIKESKEKDPVLKEALRFIEQQTEFYRNIYLQQNRIIYSKKYSFQEERGVNPVSLRYLIKEFKKFVQNSEVEIVNEKVVLEKMIKGERNWMGFAFKNIATLISSEFPEINPIKIEIVDKIERSQLMVKFDFKKLKKENKLKFSRNVTDDKSLLYNCLKIMEMNRGNIFYLEETSELVLILPHFDQDIAHDEEIVLVADADWNSRQRCKNALSTAHYKVKHFETSDPNSTLKVSAEIEPDFIILDPYFYTENNNIVDLIESLYAVQMDRKPQLLIFTNYSKIAHQLKELYKSFSFDFIRKEITDQELEISLSQSVSNARSLKILNDLAQDVRRISEIDSLTGAFNRAFYDELIKRELDKAKSKSTTIGIIASDIDNFKNYNDVNGHLAGDQLLRVFVTILKDNVRASDYVVRYGGEEFIIVLINASPKSIYNIAEKIRKAVDEHKFKYESKQISGNLTASFGISCFPRDGDNVEDLFRKADKNLYKAKRSGKNKVVGKI